MTRNVVCHNGQQAFISDGSFSLNDGVWNFVDSAPPPPPTACVVDALRSRLTSVVVGYNGVQNRPQRTADATSLFDITGWDATNNRLVNQTLYPYGVDGIGFTLALPTRGKYLALKFHTPPSGHWSGSLGFQSNNARGCHNTDGSTGPCGQPFFDVSISTQCNDYDHAVYKKLHAYSDGMPSLNFTQGYGPDLQPNTDYYLNLRFADPNDYWRTCFIIWHMRQL